VHASRPLSTSSVGTDREPDSVTETQRESHALASHARAAAMQVSAAGARRNLFEGRAAC